VIFLVGGFAEQVFFLRVCSVFLIIIILLLHHTRLLLWPLRCCDPSDQTDYEIMGFISDLGRV
jgi:hypothetical protein